MSLVSDTRLLLSESSAVFWPDQQIYDALNKAQLEVYRTTKPLGIQAQMPTMTGQALIKLPPSIMIPKYLMIGGKIYFFTTHTQLEQHNPKWLETSTGFPKHWVIVDAFYVRPYPRPDDDYNVIVWGAPWPTEITASVQDISAHRELKNAIIFRAASSLFEYTRPDLAEAYTLTSEEHLDRYKTQLRNNHPHNIQRLAPGSRLAMAQRGQIKLGGYYR